MNDGLETIVLVLLSSLVFGGVWAGMTKLTATPFAVASVSFFFGLLVYVSRTLFGFNL